MLTGPRRKGYSMALEYRKVTEASDTAEKVSASVSYLVTSSSQLHCLQIADLET